VTEAQQADTPTPPNTLQDDNGQVFIPQKDNRVSSSSQQLVYTPERPATSAIPALRLRQPQRDLGIDTAQPISPRTDLREEPSEQSAVVRTVTRRDLLALIHRAPKDGWYDVIDIHSGDGGWVRQSDVSIVLTEHPLPPAKFSEEYVGTNSAPEVTVANQTSSTLNLRIGDASPQKLQPGEHQIPIPEGTLDFYATVPDAIPAHGRETFRRGYRYKWSFWIEMHSTRIP